MGACETLNAAGFNFLADLGAPFSNDHGDRLAPLALVLETYARNPAGKHTILESFAQRGYALRISRPIPYSSSRDYPASARE